MVWAVATHSPEAGAAVLGAGAPARDILPAIVQADAFERRGAGESGYELSRRMDL